MAKLISNLIPEPERSMLIRASGLAQWDEKKFNRIVAYIKSKHPRLFQEEPTEKLIPKRAKS